MLMKCTRVASLVVLAVTGLASHDAHAQGAEKGGDEGLYVSAFGGIAFPSFSNPRFNGTAAAVKPKGKTGYGFGGAVGYSYGYGLSGEVEILWQTGDLSETGLQNAGLGSTGSIASLMAFANAVYKFENLGSGKFRPYVGAGLGYIEEIDSDLILAGGGAAEFASSSGFGWQLKGGVDIALSPSWSVDLGLRYINAGRTTLTGTAGTLNVGYNVLNTTIGITKRF